MAELPSDKNFEKLKDMAKESLAAFNLPYGENLESFLRAMVQTYI